MSRDQKNTHKLHEMGWKVIIVWECELKKKNLNTRLDSLKDEIIAPIIVEETGNM